MTYAASPAAAELRPLFDGPRGEEWRRIGCNQTGAADAGSAACPEILSGWFMWALREAVAFAGHAGSAADARTFYDRLADEIDVACARVVIPCGPPRATLMPPFRWHYLADAAAAGLQVAGLLTRFGGGDIGPAPSAGPRVPLLNFADVVGPISPPAARTRILDGWIGGPAAAPELRVRGAAPSNTSIETAAPDGRPAPPGVARHFTILTDCASDCELVVSIAGRPEVAIAFDRLAAGDVPIGADARLVLEFAKDWDPARATTLRRTGVVRVARAIAWTYAHAAPALTALGAAGLALALLRRRETPPDAVLLTLALASLVAVAGRVALLAYIEATSLPAANMLYAAPASPFVILFAVLGCVLGWRAFRPC